jgi:hypothetical protein
MGAGDTWWQKHGWVHHVRVYEIRTRVGLLVGCEMREVMLMGDSDVDANLCEHKILRCFFLLSRFRSEPSPSTNKETMPPIPATHAVHVTQ